VSAVFILGLAAGARAAETVRSRGGDALLLYGRLELATGACGLAVTLVLLRAVLPLTELLGALASRLTAVGAALALAALLVGPVAGIMGAAFPVLLNALRGEAAREAPVLYALNILGGVAGALATGFVLLWKLGVTRTALLGLAVSTVVWAVTVRGAARGQRDPGGAPRAATAATSPGYGTLALASGLLALAYEMLWVRLAKLYLGDRTLATSSLLAIFLLGLAAGSLAVRPLVAWLRPTDADATRRLARWAMALGGIVQLVSVRALHELAGPLSEAGVGWRLAAMLATALPPVALQGLAFPLLLHTDASVGDLPSRAVGRLTFLNAVAGALGAVAGGTLLPRAVGTAGGFIIGAAAATLLAVLAERPGRGLSARAALGSAVAVAALLGAAALVPRSFARIAPGEKLVALHEDEYGLQVVTRSPRGYLKVRNDRSFIAYHLGHPATSFTQQTMAYFTCVAARDCRDVLNVGTGYGITAGAFTRMPAVEKLVTVEVLPFICREQALFAPFNFEYYRDPRVRARCGDGRQVLASSREAWDVIAVNVLDPYVPGSSGLYTMEFWRLARQRLRAGGVYAQLVWGPDLPMLAGGLRKVFPEVGLFPTGYQDSFTAIALTEPLPGGTVRHLDRLSAEALAALGGFGVADPRAFVEARIREAFSPAAEERMAGWAASPEAGRHTDDRPLLEYRWSQSGRYVSAFDSLMTFDDGL
jgi:spermidine synthase